MIDEDRGNMKKILNQATTSKEKQSFFEQFTEPVFIFSLILTGIAFVYIWLAVCGNGLQIYRYRV